MIDWSAVVAGVMAIGAAQAPRTVVVEVGDTVEVAVGWATGHACDDPSIVTAEVRAASPDTNVFVVTGRAPGITACRVGTTLGRPSLLFQIEVVPTRPRDR